MYVCVSVTLKRLDVVTYRCCQQLVLPRRSCSCGNNRSARTRVPGRPKEPYIVGSSREVSPFVQKTHLEFNPSRWVVKHRFFPNPDLLVPPPPPLPIPHSRSSCIWHFFSDLSGRERAQDDTGIVIVTRTKVGNGARDGFG